MRNICLERELPTGQRFMISERARHVKTNARPSQQALRRSTAWTNTARVSSHGPCRRGTVRAKQKKAAHARWAALKESAPGYLITMMRP
jgi:hypothetical protein